MTRELNDEHTQRYNQYCDCDVHHLVNVDWEVAHHVYHVASQRSDGYVQKETNRHMVGLEVDADHGSELEIDEEQEDVSDGGERLLEHRDECRASRPNGGAADSEQRKSVEYIDEYIASFVYFIHAKPSNHDIRLRSRRTSSDAMNRLCYLST
jgi:hypothetical protein